MHAVLGSGEAVNIIGFAKDHPVIEVTDVGNGHNDRIIETHALCHFGLHSGDLLIQKFKLSDHRSDLDGQRLGGVID